MFESEKKYKVCCLTGHRPQGFPWNYYDSDCEARQKYISELQTRVKALIKQGYNYFISGCALGADLDFAEICLNLRDGDPACGHILVEGAIPCEKQAAHWSVPDKLRYERVLKKMDYLHYVSRDYSPSCFQLRNEYMVDSSEHVLAVWNGIKKGGTWNTVKYALKKGKEIEHISLSPSFN